MAAKRQARHGVGDMILLSEISEAGILGNLRERYDHDEIYTYIGHVLISVNPYKLIGGLYDKSKIDEYNGRTQWELPPHVYGVADRVHKQMLQNHANQALIISGESGAGKTEAAKKIMAYISAVTGSSAQIEHVKTVILDSNPVLEAFGNAKTIVNNNSSRFGKYFEIQFDFKGDPIGGLVSNYLLEKSRVVSQMKGERNFHIFYQLLNSSHKGEFHLDGPDAYLYTKDSVFSVDGMNDANEFRDTEKAMKSVGCSDGEVSSVLRTVAGILHLGNVEFGGGEPAEPNARQLQTAAGVLSLPPQQLAQALQFRTISAAGDVKRIPARKDGAVYARDAFAKALYFRLFNWIVRKINASIATPKVETTIGVLDIYGFEIFPVNSFEQLCINYCNERLQQIFIELTLKSEQEEYVREGIQWEDVDYFNNKPCVDLIEAVRPAGILKILDEECIFPKGTDKSLLEKLNQNLKTNAYYVVPNVKGEATQFQLRHYAGDVTYDVSGFLDKSKDTLFKDLKLLMLESGNPFYQQLFDADREYLDDRKRPPTAGAQFGAQMRALSERLMACETHYIRCIRPNGTKRANNWDAEMSGHQVRYLGLLENVRVRRAGYAFRTDYPRFQQRFKMICKDTWPNPRGRQPQQVAEMIMHSQNFKTGPDFQLGKTKIFIKDPKTLFHLEDTRDAAVERLVTRIQARWRGYIARVHYERLRAVVCIQRVFRVYLTRRLHLKMRARATHIYSGNKKRLRGTLYRDYNGDYLGFAQDPAIKQLLKGPKGLFTDTKIVFADVAIMLWGPKLEQRHVWVIITDLATVVVDFVKKVKILHRLAHDQVAKIGLSKEADHTIIIYSAELKAPVDLVLQTPKKTEMVVRYSNQFAKKNLNKEFIFENNQSYKVKKAVVNIVFEAGNSEAVTSTVNAKAKHLAVQAAAGEPGEGAAPGGEGGAPDKDLDHLAEVPAAGLAPSKARRGCVIS